MATTPPTAGQSTTSNVGTQGRPNPRPAGTTTNPANPSTDGAGNIAAGRPVAHTTGRDDELVERITAALAETFARALRQSVEQAVQQVHGGGTSGTNPPPAASSTSAQSAARHAVEQAHPRPPPRANP